LLALLASLSVQLLPLLEFQLFRALRPLLHEKRL
jgi:hypothetical protein